MGLVTPTFSFGAQVVELEVDEETGGITVDKVNTAHDCGRALNPMAVEGQLEGSIHMGLGYALSEELVMDGGHTVNTSFLDYKIPAAEDMPLSESAHIPTYEPDGPFGAKEAGEGMVSPTAPAIVNRFRSRCRAHLPGGRLRATITDYDFRIHQCYQCHPWFSPLWLHNPG